MKKNRKLLGLLMAASFFGASAVMAQPGQGGGYSGSGPGKEQRGGPGKEQRGGPGMHRGGPPGQGERATPTGQAPGAGGASPYAYAPGQLKKGDRLPTAYRDRQYVIDDWQAYKLPRPPRGHRWVGIGGDYLLVTGNGTVVQVESGR